MIRKNSHCPNFDNFDSDSSQNCRNHRVLMALISKGLEIESDINQALTKSDLCFCPFEYDYKHRANDKIIIPN